MDGDAVARDAARALPATLADDPLALQRAIVRLQGLQRMTAALGQALRVADVVRVVEEVLFAVAGVDRGGVALLDPRTQLLQFHPATRMEPDVRDRWGAVPLTDPAPHALSAREGRAVYLADRTAMDAGFPEAAPQMPPGQARAFLPLRRRSGPGRRGVLVMVWDVPRSFPPAEREFLETVAAQCAQAIDRVQLFEAQARAASDLQRALLPAQLPELAGIESAARYLTAEGDAVGGDWYDVLPLPDGTVGLVMGDVEGHSTAAAALMGTARNVLRAYAAEAHTPGRVLALVNTFLLEHASSLVTCCLVTLRPQERLVTVVSAGHPGPVVVEPDGRAWQLEVDPGPPLGVGPADAFPEQTSVLPPGCAVALYTDGLVDAGSHGLHEGLEGLLAAVRRTGTTDPHRLADVLTARGAGTPPLRPGPSRSGDDAALLVVRLVGAPSTPDDVPSASRVLRPTASATPAARHFVRDVLHDWSLDAVGDEAELSVSELVTNAVLHTASDVRLTLRREGAAGVWIGVQDDSDRMPQRTEAADDDIAGRGLAIVELVADAWGVDAAPGGAGKTVWLTLSAG